MTGYANKSPIEAEWMRDALGHCGSVAQETLDGQFTPVASGIVQCKKLTRSWMGGDGRHWVDRRVGGPCHEPSPASENPPSPSIKTILLVDDGDETRITTIRFLSSFGYAVEAARNAQEALSLLNPKTHDGIITDKSTPGMTGVEMAHLIKLRAPATPVLMYTGLPPDDRCCLDLVIQRPTHMLALEEAVEKLLAGRG